MPAMLLGYAALSVFCKNTLNHFDKVTSPMSNLREAMVGFLMPLEYINVYLIDVEGDGISGNGDGGARALLEENPLEGHLAAIAQSHLTDDLIILHFQLLSSPHHCTHRRVLQCKHDVQAGSLW